MGNRNNRSISLITQKLHSKGLQLPDELVNQIAHLCEEVEVGSITDPSTVRELLERYIRSGTHPRLYSIDNSDINDILEIIYDMSSGNSRPS